MSRIIILKRRFIEPSRELILPSRIQGWYKMEAISVRTGRRRLLADWFPNLITNAGLDAIGSSNIWANACKVGNSSATPSVLDTSMGGFVAGTTTSQSFANAAQSSSPYYGYSTKTYRFAVGAAAGNLTEVGIGSAATNTGTLFSRALIIDGGSPTTPTSITVLSDEVLDVTYQLRNYPSTEGNVTGTITISGITYDYVARAIAVTSTSYWSPLGTGGGFIGGAGSTTFHSGGLAAITASTPSGLSFSSSTDTNLSYGAGSYYRDWTAQWGLTAGNNVGSPSGLRTLRMAMGSSGLGAGTAGGAWQIEFTPNIEKTSSQVLTLVLRHAWARYGA